MFLDFLLKIKWSEHFWFQIKSETIGHINAWLLPIFFVPPPRFKENAEVVRVHVYVSTEGWSLLL